MILVLLAARLLYLSTVQHVCAWSVLLHKYFRGGSEWFKYLFG